MSMRSRASRTTRNRQSQVVQRKTPSTVPEEAELPPPSISAQLQAAQRGHSLSTVSLGGSLPVQAKLSVNQPGDAYEQEADQVAAQVMRMPADLNQSPELPSASTTRPSYIQRVAGKAGLPVSSAVESDISQMQGGGQTLPEGERSFFEQRFGHDFSQVRIHADPHAAETARSLNARAFTVGSDIAFDAGEYQPGTESGRHLLAHELTHVVQQGGAGEVVQRLIRTPYPWTGVILPADGAELKSSPDAGKPSNDAGKQPSDADKQPSDLGKQSNDTTNPSNSVICIPKGQKVKVLSSSGNFLQVETTYEGKLVCGYIDHTLVDDAAAHAMEANVGTTMVWDPSGPGSGTDFETWASAKTETPFPTITPTTVMNCWEAVLLAAYQAGVIDWNWIHKLYTSTPVRDWAATMSRGSMNQYLIPGPNPVMPQRGDIVFFDGINGHTAMATGNGSDVFTFWPPPDKIPTGANADKVKVCKIEEIFEWCKKYMPPEPKITFGPPSW